MPNRKSHRGRRRTPKRESLAQSNGSSGPSEQTPRALSKPMWNPASIMDMMSDDLDVTEVVVLDHITAILYVGQWSASEGLTKEEAQACIDHFSPYIKWRDMAVKREFQALTLVEAREEIQAYEAQNHRSIQGREQPKMMKPSSRFIKTPMD